MKKIKLMALISALIMFLTIFMYLTLNSGDEKNIETDESTAGIIVARQNIKPLSIISEDMIEMKKVTKTSLQTDGLNKIDDVIGKICSSEIFSGEMINKNRIKEIDDPCLGLAYRLPVGKRAVSIKAEVDKGVAGNLKVGNKVDIIMSYKLDDENSAGMMLRNAENTVNMTIISDAFGSHFAYLVMQNLEIVALDENLYYNSSDLPNDISYNSITLALTPEQANKLVFCDDNMEDKEIRLALRSQNDNEIKIFNENIIIRDIEKDIEN